MQGNMEGDEGSGGKAGFALLETVRKLMEVQQAAGEQQGVAQVGVGVGHEASGGQAPPDSNAPKFVPMGFISPHQSAKLAQELIVAAPMLKKKSLQRPAVPGGPCANCGIVESPQWRRPTGKKIVLCNACGIYYSRHHSLPKRKKANTAPYMPSATPEDGEGVPQVPPPTQAGSGSRMDISVSNDSPGEEEAITAAGPSHHMALLQQACADTGGQAAAYPHLPISSLHHLELLQQLQQQQQLAHSAAFNHSAMDVTMASSHRSSPSRSSQDDVVMEDFHAHPPGIAALPSRPPFDAHDTHKQQQQHPLPPLHPNLPHPMSSLLLPNSRKRSTRPGSNSAPSTTPKAGASDPSFAPGPPTASVAPSLSNPQQPLLQQHMAGLNTDAFPFLLGGGPMASLLSQQHNPPIGPLGSASQQLEPDLPHPLPAAQQHNTSAAAAEGTHPSLSHPPALSLNLGAGQTVPFNALSNPLALSMGLLPTPASLPLSQDLHHLLPQTSLYAGLFSAPLPAHSYLSSLAALRTATDAPPASSTAALHTALYGASPSLLPLPGLLTTQAHALGLPLNGQLNGHATPLDHSNFNAQAAALNPALQAAAAAQAAGAPVAPFPMHLPMPTHLPPQNTLPPPASASLLRPQPHSGTATGTAGVQRSLSGPLLNAPHVPHAAQAHAGRQSHTGVGLGYSAPVSGPPANAGTLQATAAQTLTAATAGGGQQAAAEGMWEAAAAVASQDLSPTVTPPHQSQHDRSHEEVPSQQLEPAAKRHASQSGSDKKGQEDKNASVAFPSHCSRGPRSVSFDASMGSSAAAQQQQQLTTAQGVPLMQQQQKPQQKQQKGLLDAHHLQLLQQHFAPAQAQPPCAPPPPASDHNEGPLRTGDMGLCIPGSVALSDC